MPTPLDLFPARVAIGRVDGKPVFASPEFIRALGDLFIRVGGANAPSNSELALTDDDDSGLEEFKAELAKALDGLGMQPTPEPVSFTDPMQPLVHEHVAVEYLLTELAGLREQVAALQTQINDLQQGTYP